MLFIANGPGNDPHNPAFGRILLEQDLKTARIVDARIAEAFDRLDISTDEEFRVLSQCGFSGNFGACQSLEVIPNPCSGWSAHRSNDPKP